MGYPELSRALCGNRGLGIAGAWALRELLLNYLIGAKSSDKNVTVNVNVQVVARADSPSSPPPLVVSRSTSGKEEGKEVQARDKSPGESKSELDEADWEHVPCEDAKAEREQKRASAIAAHERAHAAYKARWSNGCKTQGRLKLDLRRQWQQAATLQNAEDRAVMRWKCLVHFKVMSDQLANDQKITVLVKRKKSQPLKHVINS